MWTRLRAAGRAAVTELLHGGQVITTKGWLPLTALRLDKRVKAIQCGHEISENYYLGDELVKRNVDIVVDPEYWAKTMSMGGHAKL